jgi:hypothetical protein
MNVGTITTTAAADPVMSLSGSNGSGAVAREGGGFAAVLRDVGGPSTGAETGANTTDRATGAPNDPTDPGAEDSTAAVAPEGDGNGNAGNRDAVGDGHTTGSGDPSRNEIAEAAAAELLLITWQRSTAVAATATPGGAPTEAATTPLATDLPLTTAAAPVFEAVSGPATGGIPEVAVPLGTDTATDEPGLDLTGLRAVPETPLETVDHQTVDLEAARSGTTTADDGRTSQRTVSDAARLAALTGAGAASTNAAAAGTAAADLAPIGTTPSAPTVDAPVSEAPALDPTTSGTPQAPTRSDALAAPTATIRADELQRAIADTARQLAEQGGGRHRINVRITSPDLGQVVIEIVSRGSEVRVTMQPQDLGAGGSLQQQHQAVARALATEGFTLSGFDVQTGHPDGRGREDAPHPQGNRTVDDELDLIDLTATDDGALRL